MGTANYVLFAKQKVLQDNPFPPTDIPAVGRKRDRMKTVLDVCCGSKMFWFDKSDDRVIFCDKRVERHILNYPCGDYDVNVSPSVLSDFTALPFPSNYFQVVVFDPPHLNKIGKNSWVYKKYGSLDGDWRSMLRDGFSECFRVLVPNGTLIFKWSSVQILLSEILELVDERPLFGHKSGKRSLTHWVTFAKSPRLIYQPWGERETE